MAGGYVDCQRHFARECRSGRSQRRRSYGDNYRRNVTTNESSSQALVAQDGLGGYDWSNDFEVEPVNYALMAISSSSSSSSSDSETGLDLVMKRSTQLMGIGLPKQISYLSDYEDINGALWLLEMILKEDELKFNLFSVSQMCDKKNSVLFTESECLILSPSFKLLDESQVILRAPRKDDVYNLDLKNIVPSGGITCLYVNATADESKLWHRRLGHVNFKNINKLVKGHLVRGLPSKVFVNDHTCVACKKGKQHKASCKAKLERIIRKPLELLHMDLFGPVSVESINKKRCDNGTEFKNYAMNELCAKKGIKREFSVARTPQQNGSSRNDKGPTQEYILLLLQPHRIRIPVKDVVQDAQEQPSENASPDKDELEMMVTQELAAKAIDDVSRQAFEKEKRRIASQKKAAQATSTNQLSTDRPSVSTYKPFVTTDRSFVSTDRSNTPNVSAASTSTGANADESSFVYLGGKIHIDASTLPNVDLHIDPNMLVLEDASDTLPSDGIFNGAYDDDKDVGAEADFNNMDNIIAVSPIPTLKIHKDHPKGQILGDPTD
ncbi:putative ribonuclease H-like domain-containing protein, partial [Tanacetum coccineum]